MAFSLVPARFPLHLAPPTLIVALEAVLIGELLLASAQRSIYWKVTDAHLFPRLNASQRSDLNAKVMLRFTTAL
jgi:hypothetical protein